MSEARRPTPPDEPRPAIRENPYLERLKGQGLSFQIPEILANALPHERRRDRLTGMPLESGRTRGEIVGTLSDCLREDRPWALIYTDADNLKSANDDIERKFGDLVIVQGAVRLGTALKNAQLSSRVEVIAFRPSDAADEICVWLFDVNEDELGRLRAELAKIETPIPIQNPAFELSSSATMISSSDESIRERLEEAKEFLSGDAENLEHQLYEELKTMAGKTVTKKKIEKRVEKLKNISPTLGVEGYMEALAEVLSGKRLSHSEWLDVLKMLKDKIDGVKWG